ncbi:MAG: hypothetical protein A2X86_08055 [Bdellovibrionales bacterium GWA2_49_15]|nr:MAG: hypothetical protein A2X86_08055 [Bdellovibrionales bacterium GWA2_49_15]HAZ13277.1 hypothetical protein [Bdellovibrionales bacterium]
MIIPPGPVTVPEIVLVVDDDVTAPSTGASEVLELQPIKVTATIPMAIERLIFFVRKRLPPREFCKDEKKMAGTNMLIGMIINILK